MQTKIDACATDHGMGLNFNDQEPGGISKKTNLTDDQEQKKFSKKSM